MQQLFPMWFSVRGRFNYVNIGRMEILDERTLRRWFARSFSWLEFNRRLLEKIIPAENEMIAALDASFVPKSGKKTFGLGNFFNGCLGRAQKGLEISLMSVVDTTKNTAYAMSARQTPPGEKNGISNNQVPSQKPKGQRPKGKDAKNNKEAEKETRVDAYLDHFKEVRPFLPRAVRHLAVDGYYTSYKFVQGVCAFQMDIVGKLRRDADLRYLYKGPQQGRGRPRLYDGKVQWSKMDMRRWKKEGELDKGTQLYSASLYHISLKRTIRVVLLQETSAGKMQCALLFSTDLQLSARDIVRYYKARFQIEFLFRDAKQATGLNHCQARNEMALQFHWNAALCAVNLAKWQEAQRSDQQGFSVSSCKLRHSNQRLLELFSHKLGLDWTWIKSHPEYPALCSYGAIRP
jgi:hypothetical protein